MDYFMSEMAECEVLDFYNVIEYSNRELKEIGRAISYFCCLPHLKNKCSMNEFMHLPFDESPVEEHITEITNEEISMMSDEVKRIKAILYKEEQ